MKNSDCNSIDIIKKIAASNVEDIQSFNFTQFDTYDIVQSDTSNQEFNQVVEKALVIRDDYHLPFWDCFNLSCFNVPFKNFDFLKRVRFHNEKKKTLIIAANELNSFLDSWNYDDYITFNSKVVLKNESIAHFVLLDFHIPVSKENAKLCTAILSELNLTGSLLDSGKSFHFIGKEMITQEKLFEILYNCLLFTPIIDRAWIAHQLIQKNCCLRISKKYDRLPTFVK